jgi:ubiquinone/menaquinone biosynthesis C-methylase UbiE
MTVILALKGAEVWALDVSEAAIERQRLMARENGVENSITAVLGAGEALPLPSQSFDVVFR